MKTIYVLVAVFALNACVSTHIVRNNADGNVTQVEGNYLTTASAERLLRVTQDGDNELGAVKVNGENGYLVSVSATNADGSARGVNASGYGTYGYGGYSSPYQEANARYGARNVPPPTPTSGKTDTGTADPDLAKKVAGLETDMTAVKGAVKVVLKDRAHQHTREDAAATDP